jgi:hypothetical protein
MSYRTRALALFLALLALGCGSSDAAGPGGTPDAVASVRIGSVPIDLSLHPGDSIRLVATARDAAGRAVTGRTATWSSEDTDIATVSSAGWVRVLTRGDGTVKITATIDGISASVKLDIWGWWLETSPGIVRLRQKANFGAESGGAAGLPQVLMECFTGPAVLDLFVAFPFATDGSGRVEYRFNGEQTVTHVWNVGQRGPAVVIYPGEDMSFAEYMAQKDTLFFSTIKINGESSAMVFTVRGLQEFLPVVQEAC